MWSRVRRAKSRIAEMLAAWAGHRPFLFSATPPTAMWTSTLSTKRGKNWEPQVHVECVWVRSLRKAPAPQAHDNRHDRMFQSSSSLVRHFAVVHVSIAVCAYLSRLIKQLCQRLRSRFSAQILDASACLSDSEMDQLDLPPRLSLDDMEDEAHDGSHGGIAGGRAADGFGGPVAHGGGSDGEAVADAVQQLVLPAPLLGAAEGGQPEQRLRFPDAHGRAAYARSVLALQRANARAKRMETSSTEAREDLALVSAVLPGVGQLLGQTTRKRVFNKLDTQPVQYCALALAAFLPTKLKLAVGVNRKRLIAAATQCLLNRQDKGLQLLLANALLFLKANRRANASIIACYSHEWDESRAIFRQLHSTQTAQLRFTGGGAAEQVMVQRGTLNLCCSDNPEQGHTTFREEWLVPPRVVLGTSAAELLPALEMGMPGQLWFTNEAGLEEMVARLGVVVFQPIGDAAASNISIMKWWALSRSTWPAEIQGGVLLFADTCQAHAHHRAKLQVASLRVHTSRHFSLSHLYRLPNVQRRLVAEVEARVDESLERVLQEPPPESQSLKVFFDILFDLSDPRHDRKQGKSVMYADIQELLRMANGDMSGGRMVHCCWTASGAPCCRNATECKERFTIAVLNLVLAPDAVPCESRWTNTLPNMKKTLVRKVLFNLGLLAFTSDAGQVVVEATSFGDDAAAHAEYLQQLNGVRAQKARAYYGQERNFHELAVLTIILGVVDKLLFAMLGGVDRQAPPCKLGKLLARETSLVGQMLSDLLHLMTSWSEGGEQRRPWCILSLLDVPLRDQTFALWARSQILSMAAAVARRYEFKYAAWPFPLFKLHSPDWDLAQRLSVAHELLKSPACCLDTFAAGVRQRHSSVGALMSSEAKQLLDASFDAHRLTTDWCERQHAEITAAKPPRGGGRDFANSARENVLRQAKVVHMHNGGTDPNKPEHIKASASACECLVMPLLAPLAPAPSGRQDERNPPQGQQGRSVGSSTAPAARQSSDRAPILDAGAASPTAMVPSSRHSLCELVPVSLEGQAEVQAEDAGPPRKKLGLSPYMLFKNSLVKAARATKTAPLTPQELRDLAAHAKERWANFAGHEAHEELYQSWRDSAAAAPASPMAKAPYTPMWGGGTRASPISAFELYRFHREMGWPPDSAVYKSTEFHTGREAPAGLAEASNFNLFGCCRNGIGLCRAQLAHAGNFDLAHKGLCNFLERIGRPAADGGQTMIMIEGCLREAPSELRRRIGVIAGVCWSPRMFEVAECKFENPEHEAAVVLPAEFTCSIQSRAIRGEPLPYELQGMHTHHAPKRVPPLA